MRVSVIHDWDSSTISGRKAIRRGISLVLYAISKVFPILNRIRRIERNNDALELERVDYMETLIKLDLLLGIDSIFGIRPGVMRRCGEEIKDLKELYGVDVRTHLHIGSPPDPGRKRLWIPSLSQSMKSWTFEKDYIEGRGELEPGDLPIFHVDNPENLRYYIDYLYDERFEKKSLIERFSHPSKEFLERVAYTPEELKRILSHLRKIEHIGVSHN